MKVSLHDISPIYSEGHHGGNGLTTLYPCYSAAVAKSEPETVIKWVGAVELASGASIKEHAHDNEEEVYIIISGEGIYTEDGQDMPIAEKDVLVLQRGHSHGMRNTGLASLIFYAVVTS